MIPGCILEPALEAQTSTEAASMLHQKNAVSAAWKWGLEEFSKRPERRSPNEARRSWTLLAGEEPYWHCCRGGFEDAAASVVA
jgi:hypothetical protein